MSLPATIIIYACAIMTVLTVFALAQFL